MILTITGLRERPRKYIIWEENLVVFTEDGPNFDEFKNETLHNNI
jgi:hypothetical protein